MQERTAQADAMRRMEAEMQVTADRLSQKDAEYTEALRSHYDSAVAHDQALQERAALKKASPLLAHG